MVKKEVQTNSKYDSKYYNRQKQKYGIGKQGKINLYYFDARFRDSNIIGK